MKIYVCDWMCGPSLIGSGYEHGSETEGSVDDAFKIARTLYDRGLNVMVRRNLERNEGTRKRPVIVPGSITVFVDTRGFQQR